MSGRLSRNQIWEVLTDMILAMRQDPDLTEWFEALCRLSNVQRRNQLYSLQLKLIENRAGVREELIVPLTWLRDDRVFEAAREAFRTA